MRSASQAGRLARAMEKTTKYVSIARYVLANIVAEPQRYAGRALLSTMAKAHSFIG
jgi:hypothetical protein